MRLRQRAGIVATIVAFAGCEGTGIGGPGASTIAIRSARQLNDTVGGFGAQPVMVEVRDHRGDPEPGVLVRFTSVRIPPADSGGIGAMVYFEASTRLLDTMSVRTDGAGQASVPVRVSCVAGEVAVAVAVPERGWSDTVWYSVRAGAPASVRVLPTDTVVRRGNSYPLRVSVLDRCSNDTRLPATISADPGVSVDGALRVSGVAYARARITARAAGLEGSALVSVVPAGRIAAMVGYNGGTLAVFETDGSARQTYGTALTTRATTPTWSGSGQEILLAQEDYTIGSGERAVALDVASGAMRRILPDTATHGRRRQFWPEASRDGQWVYLSLQPAPPLGSGIWRVRPDGSALTELVVSPPYGGYASPSPAPDGNRVAFLDRAPGGAYAEVRVVDLRTGTTTVLRGLGPDVVRWSPRGDKLATRGGIGVHVVNPDGTGVRLLSGSSNQADEGIGWSPDGEWLVWRANELLQLLHVESGLILPLPFARNYSHPTWAPSPAP